MGIRTLLRAKLTFLNTKNEISQSLKFGKIGLDRSSALKKLNGILKKNFDTEYNENSGMWSEHLLLLSAISQLAGFVPNPKILEIGTFRGETTLIISHLFPNSKLKTIDLPDTLLANSST